MVDLGPPPASSFASDNAAGVHPAALAAVAAANQGPAVAYGADPWTERAVGRLRELFGAPVDVAFCWGGSGANLVGLQCLLGPGEAIICPESAHLNTDEGGAPERVVGAKVVGVPGPDGKLAPEGLLDAYARVGGAHRAQPRAVSITQSTESGTLYTPAEIAVLADLAHDRGLYLHLDGARIANAAAALGVPVTAFTTDVGVDIVTFGGTKGGLMAAEAVVCCNPALAPRLPFAHKQAGQLASKMRFVAAQVDAYLTDDLWLANARVANDAAAALADGVAAIEGVELSHHPEVNAVFARLPQPAIEALLAWSFFYVWDAAAGEVRWMTNFQTTPADVERFVAGVARAVAASDPTGGSAAGPPVT
jgi:threonine aldolase